MSSKRRNFSRCSNPFGLQKHSTKRKGLRHPSQEFVTYNPSLCRSDLLCPTCRKQMGIIVKQNIALPPVPKSQEAVVPSENPSPDVSHESNMRVRTKRSALNDALELVERSLIPKKKLRSSDKKLVDTKPALVSTTPAEEQSSRIPSKRHAAQDNGWDIPRMMEELKQKFHAAETDNSAKIQILTLLPESWSVATIAKEMNTTLHMARSARSLYRDKGILSIPNDRLNQTLSSELKSQIVEFYQSDKVSFEFPGIKNYIGTRDENDTKIHQQKRLILCNLKELHQLFKERNPELKVGFSMFASQRPKHCVLAGSSGTHTHSVCAMHQNMKLMIEGCSLPNLTKDCEPHLTSYQDCVKFLRCTNFGQACNLRACADCPSHELLREMLIRAMESNDIEYVTYKQWVPKERTTLVIHTTCAAEFATEFYDHAKVLLKHSFIAKQQSDFVKSIKNSLTNGECLVTCDFAENHMFVLQDATNGFRWNDNQATLYPVVIYYKDGDNQLAHKNLIVISDCLDHDPTAVYMFSRHINNFIRTFITNPSKVFYSSVGDLQHFKSYTNFLNVYYHQADFGVPAEWHFFAAAHGRGPCSRIAGTVRRLAAKHSLQSPLDQQMTMPQELYDWARLPGNLFDIDVRYVDRSEYQVAMNMLKERFAQAKPIPKIQESHCIIPAPGFSVLTKIYSADTEHKIYPIFESQ